MLAEKSTDYKGLKKLRCENSQHHAVNSARLFVESCLTPHTQQNIADSKCAARARSQRRTIKRLVVSWW